MAPIKEDIKTYKLPVHTKELESFSTTLFEFSSDAMLVLDAVGKISSVNTSLCNLIGDDKENLIGKIPDFLFAGGPDVSSYKTFIHDLIVNGYWQGQVLGRSRSGAIIPIEVRFSAIYNEIGEANHYVGICSSIYSYISKMNEMPFDPNIDPLTKIFNKNAFEHRLQHNIHKIEKDMSVLSLLYIDIDNFDEFAKADNYQAGDIILKNLALELKNILDESDTVARLKADIFCAIIQDVYTQDSINTLVNKIFEKITSPYILHPKIECIPISIGVATFPISGETTQDLIAASATASKKAKINGGNQISFHKLLTDIE